MNAPTPDNAIALIVKAINIWLTLTDAGRRVAAHDIVVTERDGVLFLAFRVERPRGRAG